MYVDVWAADDDESLALLSQSEARRAFAGSAEGTSQAFFASGFFASAAEAL